MNVHPVFTDDDDDLYIYIYETSLSAGYTTNTCLFKMNPSLVSAFIYIRVQFYTRPR